MEIEYETKILDINIPEFKERLIKSKAACIKTRHLVKRWVFKLPNKQEKAWIRIIKVDNKITIAYKNYKNYEIGGIEESEFEINAEVEKLIKLLCLLGCELIAEQHSYEENYMLPNKVAIDIEEWPKIPPYVEIEGQSENEVLDTLQELGFNKDQSQPITTKMVYEKYDIDLHQYKLLSFD